MWPALILAANRNDKVIGRRHILIVSINTRNGFSQSGAPAGSKWAANDEGDHTAAVIIKDNHKGSPNVNVISKCLDDLNT